MKKFIMIVIAALAASFVFSFSPASAWAKPGSTAKPKRKKPAWLTDDKPATTSKPADPPPGDKGKGDKKDKAKKKGGGCPPGTKPCKHTGTCISVAKFDKECKPAEEESTEEPEPEADCKGYDRVPDESTEDPNDTRCPNEREEAQQVFQTEFEKRREEIGAEVREELEGEAWDTLQWLLFGGILVWILGIVGLVVILFKVVLPRCKKAEGKAKAVDDEQAKLATDMAGEMGQLSGRITRIEKPLKLSGVLPD